MSVKIKLETLGSYKKGARSLSQQEDGALSYKASLLRWAQEGDEQAIEELLAHYEAMLRYIVSGYYLQDGDHEDLLQEARIAFVDGIRSYDAERGMSFKNFAWLCVSRQLDSRVKKSLRKKHMVLNQALSIDEEPSEDGQDPADAYCMAARDDAGRLATPENQLLERESFSELGKLIESVLSKLEYRVLILRAAGMSYEDITQLLDLETKSVDNAIQRIRRKLSPQHVKAILQP